MHETPIYAQLKAEEMQTRINAIHSRPEIKAAIKPLLRGGKKRRK